MNSASKIHSSAEGASADGSSPDLQQHQQPRASFAREWLSAWNRFWFAGRDPATLAIIRLVVGSIVFYTHLVWTIELGAFLGGEAMLPAEYRSQLFANHFAWSHLDWVSSPSMLMVVHLVGLGLIGLFTIGMWTRWTGIATALLVISYANRATGSLFGLDQINGFLCLYLAIGNSGGAYSIDSWRKSKSNITTAGRDVLTNIATRLIQIHLCVVYFFAGIGKLQGETWLSGDAIWLALASYEYQTLDMTWIANHLWLVAALSLVTVLWEVGYAALIWPQLTRPIVLAIAIPMHLGIGFCMGMLTFGLIMLAANLAFLEPEWVKRRMTNGSNESEHL
jgi:hypothetical protein